MKTRMYFDQLRPDENNDVVDTKGLVLYFHNSKQAKPFYIYKPLNIVKKCDILKWEEETIELYQSPENNLLYIQTIYWKLEKLSCVLVSRNKIWFKNNIQALQNVWNIIEKERMTGYEHRAPNKKMKAVKENTNSINNYFNMNAKNGCLITVQKLQTS